MKKIKKRLFIAAIMVISLIILAIVSGVGLGQTFNPFSDNTFIINVLDTYNIVEEEGIEIALVFAYVDGNRISAMLKIKDLQGGRLDDNINLKFGNGNRQAFISTPVIYDELLEKALLGIGVIYDNFIGLGNSMSFSINSIMTGVEHVDFKLIEFPLYLYAIERDMISRADWEKAISKEFYDIIWSSEFSRNRRPRYFLNIDEISKYLPNINGVVVSNIGLHNDLLHIQVRHTDKWRNISNFGHLIILDTDYNKLQPVFEIRMGNYTEYVFSIDELENLNKMNLAFTGTVANKIIQGSWEFDIPITKQVNEKLITGEVKNISLSGLLFEPHNMELIETIKNDAEIPFCTLRAGKDFLSPVCRARRTGNTVSFEFISFQDTEKKSLEIYLKNISLGI